MSKISVLSLATMATMAIGCSSVTSYNEQIFPAYEAYRDGDVSAAADISSAIYEEYYDDNSRVIFALENGTMLRDAGYYQQAFDVLEQAEATLKIGYDQRSALNVGALSNPGVETGIGSASSPCPGWLRLAPY